MSPIMQRRDWDEVLAEQVADVMVGHLFHAVSGTCSCGYRYQADRTTSIQRMLADHLAQQVVAFIKPTRAVHRARELAERWHNDQDLTRRDVAELFDLFAAE